MERFAYCIKGIKFTVMSPVKGLIPMTANGLLTGINLDIQTISEKDQTPEIVDDIKRCSWCLKQNYQVKCRFINS